jgi:hypothetical protein
VEVETTRCAKKEHPEFRLVYDDQDPTVRQTVPSIVSWLEDEVLSGVRFHPGESVQFGWMYDELFARPDGTLGIVEPDFQAVPVAWTESVTLTLRHLWFQKEVAASVSLEPAFPSYRQTAIVCNQLRGASSIFMHRAEPSGYDSGWFIGCNVDAHDHQDPSQLSGVSLFEAAVAWNQRFIPYVALPPGCCIIDGGEQPKIARQDVWLSFVPGSLLAARGSGV